MVDFVKMLSHRKGDGCTYRPSAGTFCLISGPHCDDENGYTYGEFEVLWADETFILYRKDGCWPVLNKWEHIIVKPLGQPSPAAPVAQEGEKTAEQARAELLAKPLDEVVAMVRGTDASAQATFNDERARRWESKLDAVWADIRAKVERYTGKPCEGEPMDALESLLGAQAAQADLSGAARDVLAERRRQVSVEGWVPEHDDEHSDGSLAIAAACYATPSDLLVGETRACVRDVSGGRGDTPMPRLVTFTVPTIWPQSWAPYWWKPKGKRRNLVRAGALILAEIERIDRASTPADDSQPAAGGAADNQPGGGLATVHAFLLGEGPLDGVWFGDLHPMQLSAKYWWRNNLREAIAATQPKE